MAELYPEKNSPQDYGYFLSPARRLSEPGYARLEVILRDVPTLHHFDPEHIHLGVAASDGGAEMLKVSGPWAGLLHWRVCAGPVELLDRKGKHIDLYTFGGELTIENHPGFPHVIVASDAPILLASAHDEPADLFIQEVEIQLAYLRAELPAGQHIFEHCLAGVEPFELYRMCLVAILERFRHMPMRDERAHDLLRFIDKELDALGSPTMRITDLKR